MGYKLLFDLPDHLMRHLHSCSSEAEAIKYLNWLQQCAFEPIFEMIEDNKAEQKQCCENSEIETDEINGEVVCMNCGVVFSNLYVSQAKYHSFEVKNKTKYDRINIVKRYLMSKFQIKAANIPLKVLEQIKCKYKELNMVKPTNENLKCVLYNCKLPQYYKFIESIKTIIFNTPFTPLATNAELDRIMNHFIMIHKRFITNNLNRSNLFKVDYILHKIVPSHLKHLFPLPSHQCLKKYESYWYDYFNP
jgi:hypothetical protein